jgi:GNAT superfamily N-acetyltransferase
LNQPGDEVEIRAATHEDIPTVVALARRTLRWDGLDDEAFFRWKHLEGPFGQSPMWVASVDGRLAGLRTFLRWRFTEADGRTRHAARAVDTATDPDFQGGGIFRRLTLHALDALPGLGVEFVFNTPNDKSRPGYLKIGWQVIGRAPVRVMPTAIGSLPVLVRARAPADLRPLESFVGEEPADVFGDTGAMTRLLEELAGPRDLTTDRSVDYLRWRYGFAPLHYRVVLAGSALDDGVAVFHLRRRGSATEATICDVLIPHGRQSLEHGAMRRIASATRADYLLRIDRRRAARGWLPAPRSGPIVTVRDVGGTELPTLARWSLSMGDVELF